MQWCHKTCEVYQSVKTKSTESVLDNQHSQCLDWKFTVLFLGSINPVDTGGKLNVIRRTDVFWTSYVRSIYVLCLQESSLFSGDFFKLPIFYLPLATLKVAILTSVLWTNFFWLNYQIKRTSTKRFGPA